MRFPNHNNTIENIEGEYWMRWIEIPIYGQIERKKKKKSKKKSKSNRFIFPQINEHNNVNIK